MPQVVNAIIKNNKGDRVLIVKRKGGLHSGKWAFPGGIVEKGETKEQALKREINEEVGLQIKKILRKIAEYNYPGEDNSPSFGESYLVEVFNEKIKINSEISDFKWITLEELENLDYVPGLDEEIMKALFSE